MKPTGTSSRIAAITKSSTRSWPSRRWNHQASMSGIAILRISLGWIVTPTLSQRVAPLRVMPRPGSAVASNRIRPTT
jgi:N-glycosylase/DNA lyase